MMKSLIFSEREMIGENNRCMHVHTCGDDLLEDW